MNTDVIAEGVIDGSHSPVDLVQFLFQPVQMPWRFPKTQTEVGGTAIFDQWNSTECNR